MITIPAHEHGIVRVFALSMSEDEAKALRSDNGAQKAMLGASSLNSDFVEVFPMSDIAEIGLSQYLEQGNGIDPAQLAPDRAKLAALDGWVMIIYSNAFGGSAQTLAPHNTLTLIGTYAEPGVDWSPKQTLLSEAATTPASPKKKPSDAAMSGRIATLALLVLFALTALMVWVGG